jgi:hypothetical protein
MPMELYISAFFFPTAYIFIGKEVVAVDLAIDIRKDIDLECKSNTVLLQYNFGEVFGKKLDKQAVALSRKSYIDP